MLVHEWSQNRQAKVYMSSTDEITLAGRNVVWYNNACDDNKDGHSLQLQWLYWWGLYLWFHRRCKKRLILNCFFCIELWLNVLHQLAVDNLLPHTPVKKQPSSTSSLFVYVGISEISWDSTSGRYEVVCYPYNLFLPVVTQNSERPSLTVITMQLKLINSSFSDIRIPLSNITSNFIDVVVSLLILYLSDFMISLYFSCSSHMLISHWNVILTEHNMRINKNLLET